MRVNVDKVLERDQKLSELDDRAGQLFVASVVVTYVNLIAMSLLVSSFKDLRPELGIKLYADMLIVGQLENLRQHSSKKETASGQSDLAKAAQAV